MMSDIMKRYVSYAIYGIILFTISIFIQIFTEGDLLFYTGLIFCGAGGMFIGWGVGGITRVSKLENQQLKSLKEFIDRK